MNQVSITSLCLAVTSSGGVMILDERTLIPIGVYVACSAGLGLVIWKASARVQQMLNRFAAIEERLDRLEKVERRVERKVDEL